MTSDIVHSDKVGKGLLPAGKSAMECGTSRNMDTPEFEKELIPFRLPIPSPLEEMTVKFDGSNFNPVGDLVAVFPGTWSRCPSTFAASLRTSR